MPQQHPPQSRTPQSPQSPQSRVPQSRAINQPVMHHIKIEKDMYASWKSCLRFLIKENNQAITPNSFELVHVIESYPRESQRLPDPPYNRVNGDWRPGHKFIVTIEAEVNLFMQATPTNAIPAHGCVNMYVAQTTAVAAVKPGVYLAKMKNLLPDDIAEDAASRDKPEYTPVMSMTSLRFLDTERDFMRCLKAERGNLGAANHFRLMRMLTVMRPERFSQPHTDAPYNKVNGVPNQYPFADAIHAAAIHPWHAQNAAHERRQYAVLNLRPRRRSYLEIHPPPWATPLIQPPDTDLNEHMRAQWEAMRPAPAPVGRG